MTTVVGLRHEGRVVLGGDSASLSGWDQIHRLDGKVARLRTADGVAMVLGFTSSYRMGQLLMRCWDPPALAGAYPWAWAVEEAVPSVRTLLRDGGYMKVKEEREEDSGGFLVGVAGALLEFDSDLQVVDIPRFAAVGAGHAYAVGAMEVMVGVDLPVTPASKVRRALAVAARFSASTVPPFRVVST